MTTALVVSGGGDKGAFAVGAVEVLLQHGYTFDIISGTSTGALIAPLVAIDDIDELVRIYTTVTKRDIIRFNWFGFWKAWYHTKPLEALIRKTMQGQRYSQLIRSQVLVILCSIGYQTGQPLYYSQREAFAGLTAWDGFDEYVAATLASTNQPLIMPPSVLGGQQCWDGGVREIAPLKVLRSADPIDRLVIVANSPAEPEIKGSYFGSFLEIGPRSLDLMTTEILNDDLHQHFSNAEVVVIRPDAPLPTTGLEFVPEAMKEMRKIGTEKARQVLG